MGLVVLNRLPSSHLLTNTRNGHFPFFMSTLVLLLLLLLADFPVVWFLGHSLIRRLGEWVRRHKVCHGFLPVWIGIGGAKVEVVRQEFLRAIRTRPQPDYVVLHVGGNDLAVRHSGPLRHRLCELLIEIQDRVPYARVIWSDILPRMHYRHAVCNDKVDSARCTVNRYVTKFASNHGIRTIKHGAVSRKDPDDFLYDGVHLSDWGNLKFKDELWQALAL